MGTPHQNNPSPILIHVLIDNLCLKWNKIFVYPLHQALKDINEDNILHHIYLLYILQLANKKQCNVEYFRRGHGPASEKLGGGADFAAFGCEFEGPYPPLAIFDSFP